MMQTLLKSGFFSDPNSGNYESILRAGDTFRRKKERARFHLNGKASIINTLQVMLYIKYSNIKGIIQVTLVFFFELEC